MLTAGEAVPLGRVGAVGGAGGPHVLFGGRGEVPAGQLGAVQLAEEHPGAVVSGARERGRGSAGLLQQCRAHRDGLHIGAALGPPVRVRAREGVQGGVLRDGRRGHGQQPVLDDADPRPPLPGPAHGGAARGQVLPRHQDAAEPGQAIPHDVGGGGVLPVARGPGQGGCVTGGQHPADPGGGLRPRGGQGGHGRGQRGQLRGAEGLQGDEGVHVPRRQEQARDVVAGEPAACQGAGHAAHGRARGVRGPPGQRPLGALPGVPPRQVLGAPEEGRVGHAHHPWAMAARCANVCSACDRRRPASRMRAPQAGSATTRRPSSMRWSASSKTSTSSSGT
ncbi:hypothetical protein BW35_01811 [Micrococcus luteus]|nr:hypothetical protein BW35_01811 [Micrococcus luteus]